jgi:hypothetical protein
MPKVLTSFHLERNGQQIRILDEDGSVYSGEVANKPVQAVQPGKQAQSPSLDGNGFNFAFQVTGVNRGIKKKVVFNGIFQAEPASGQSGAASGGAITSTGTAQQARTVERVPQASLNQAGRVSGRVLVDPDLEFPIDAVSGTR